MGLLMGTLGLILSLSSPGFDFEENTGLGLLFQFRGARAAPTDVAIVSMDHATLGILNLPPRIDEWPRFLHATLIENLVKGGASFIAFDVFFEEPGTNDHDMLFATAVDSACNVILCESLRNDTLTLVDESGRHTADLTIEKSVPPAPLFARGAVATAPFLLPKVPIKVSRYWTFKTGAEEKPTLPAVAFQFFALDFYKEFLDILKSVNPSHAQELPPDKETVIATKSLVPLIRKLREIFMADPSLGSQMLDASEALSTPDTDNKTRLQLASIIRFYQESSNSRYLNFYGPAGTIKTIPYHQILLNDEASERHFKKPDVKGKAVFVGLSELVSVDQRDGFYTVFSESKGIDISGVEIAATAFSNFLENNPIRPLGTLTSWGVILLWGIWAGMTFTFLSTARGAMTMITAGLLYFAIAQHLFNHSGTWVPLAVPLLIQMPAAFFSALLWKHFDTNKERDKIRTVFGYYLPDKVVDQIVNQVHPATAESQIVHGICLFTDAAQYTRISEILNPKELSAFMNKYYEAVFRPVKQHGGIVSDVIGDSMLALWVSASPDSALAVPACRAALDIVEAVQRFHTSNPALSMSIRIGLHSGRMSIGSIGGLDHYEYRPVGEVVNTASRIEGLNKYLGTQILASKDVPEPDDGMVWREVGEFLLAGKSKSIIIYQLMGHKNTIDAHLSIIAIFEEALKSYRQRNWDQTIERLARILAICEDGPSRFYLNSCHQYQRNPPDENWNGLVSMSIK